jgi:Na+-translocating ferredoxin:NAD+ oxidoreductase RnfD subunit
MVGAIVCVGMFSAYRVSRLDLVLTFIGGFCVMAFIKEIVHQTGFAVVYGPLLGAGLQLFMLSMITDPKTTPATRGMRILFGLALALIDGLLRLTNNQYSAFIALAVVCAFFPLCQMLVTEAKLMLTRPSLQVTVADPVTGISEAEAAHEMSNPVKLTP